MYDMPTWYVKSDTTSSHQFSFLFPKRPGWENSVLKKYISIWRQNSPCTSKWGYIHKNLLIYISEVKWILFYQSCREPSWLASGAKQISTGPLIRKVQLDKLALFTKFAHAQKYTFWDTKYIFGKVSVRSTRICKYFFDRTPISLVMD